MLARAASALAHNGLDMGIVQRTFPDSLLLGILGMSLLALVFVLGREGLPRLADAIVRLLAGPRSAPLLLLLLGGAWLGYEALVILSLPYVGHADYADNAVVARNLLAGRGWVVDYVTQFYQLYEGTTRPQETWPLLQPVWIAPFLALFGEEAWAAKLPNLLFNSVLLLLVYTIGAYLWNRRVGLTAALIIITNYLFFNLTIYTTSDLAFVVFTLAAVYLLYLAVEESPPEDAAAWEEHAAPDADEADQKDEEDAIPSEAPPGTPPLLLHMPLLLGSAIWTGLLMLQKPSGALIAVGMGLWLIVRTLTFDALGLRRMLINVGLWSLVALLVLSPYLARNMLLFGQPVYSTESYDAWVLGYRGDSGEAWHDIYRVFAPELDGPGLPDRSWILRWGFDYTWAKFQTQLRALRDYLLPAWPGLPAALAGEDGISPLFSRNQAKNLLSPLGAWLSLIGVLAALRTRRRLLFLLFAAFTPYTLFLLTYWRTNEERYFLMLMPWLALLAAWIIWASYDRLAALGDRRWTPLALILACVAIFSIVQPSWPQIATKVQTEPDQWAPDIAAYAWISENIPQDTVIMTRNPWQLNWHTGNPAVMIPNTPEQDMVFYLADYYDAEYLVFETLQRVKGDAADTLAPLINARDAQPGAVIEGFKLVYASPTPENRVLIYRFPETTDNADADSKPGNSEESRHNE
jgi:4-amino-4-deoxy-L-arabinose transferase-like glycosyltransferase